MKWVRNIVLYFVCLNIHYYYDDDYALSVNISILLSLVSFCQEIPAASHFFILVWLARVLWRGKNPTLSQLCFLKPATRTWCIEEIVFEQTSILHDWTIYLYVYSRRTTVYHILILKWLHTDDINMHFLLLTYVLTGCLHCVVWFDCLWTQPRLNRHLPPR